MISELVIQVLLAALVLGGLAFHEPLIARLATLEDNPEVIDPEDLE